MYISELQELTNLEGQLEEALLRMAEVASRSPREFVEAVLAT
jgi:hypothetical protein